MQRDKPGALGASLIPKRSSEAEAIDVATIRLDDFCDQADVRSVAFIKCDVEGHELAAFQGGQRVLETHRPTLLFECHHHEAERGELFGYLTALGYEGYFLRGRTRIPYTEFRNVPYRKPSISFRNYIFAHPAATVAW